MDTNRDKLKLVKRFFIFNMLQQPSCFININKTKKKSSIKMEQKNNSKSRIPICDKLTMTKFLVLLKLLQRPYHNENMDKLSENIPMNIKNEDIATPTKSSLIKNSINKPNSKFMFFVKHVTFKNNSQTINKRDEIDTSDDIYEIPGNENADYFETSTPPIIIEEEDITDI